MSDLGLRIENTPLQARVERLYNELDARGIPFHPRVWLSNEWFSPDAVPGIAIPFYLAHPRLLRLEQRQMLEAEGGNERSCMKLLRHEAGHAIDTAFRLHYRKIWRDAFGRFGQKYPKYYRPRPGSRKYVVHLPAWYAQAHPAEDWAETFAVWLSPRSNWRKKYAEWPVALRKLEAVDELMAQIADEKPKNRSRRRVDPLSTLKQSLGDHYDDKRQRYLIGSSATYDRGLKRLFVSASGRQSASKFLRTQRKELRDVVVEWTGAHTYTVDQVLQEMIERCRELKLRIDRPAADARLQATILLTVYTMNCINSQRHEIPI